MRATVVANRLSAHDPVPGLRKPQLPDINRRNANVDRTFLRFVEGFGLKYHASTMEKQHYYFKLIPPRPTFPQDMTSEERAVMEEHSEYFRQQFELGRVLLYGPVMAMKGAFGLGILEVADEAEARRFGEDDPSVRAGLNRFEIHPMRVVASRAR